MRKYLFFLLLYYSIAAFAFPAGFSIKSSQKIDISVEKKEEGIVKNALRLLEHDLSTVLDVTVNFGNKGNIIIGTLGKSNLVESLNIDFSCIRNKSQAFVISVMPDNTLAIVGSDSHGTAYGIMEFSRLLGVSPWEWWADVKPRKKESFSLASGYFDAQCPSVKYRGIFINDEDWGLLPWSNKNYEKGNKPGVIGPETNKRIFELLLRLKANAYWPAMHECTYPFFMTEGNMEVAKDYGIYVGGSHCEPMACSTAGEWPLRGNGEYDFVNNSSNVIDFWQKRVKEVSGQEIIYTLGMRGVHDGKMQGAKTVEEQKKVLDNVIAEQRNMLTEFVDKNLNNIPQVFIPYKEVLDIYNYGLDVPDDVTLMWCDDNYGYIRHFPNENEIKRKGGNGIYYHVSYWGRPHDYLWLGTFSPYLLYQQMKLAYDSGIQKIWILNVGDIKPAEYQIELFMDMAWNINDVAENGVSKQLYSYLNRDFGSVVAKDLLPILNEHYRLAYIRKPEFMGNTRVEEYEKKAYYNTVRDLEWSEDYLLERVNNYESISSKVDALKKEVPETLLDAYFQLAEYPIKGAAEMNKKFIYAQLARHNLMDWSKSEIAYDSIMTLTSIYNRGIGNNGKWNFIMDAKPRKLPVFEKVKKSLSESRLLNDDRPVFVMNAIETVSGNVSPCEGLGYEGKAGMISKDSSVSYEFGCIYSDSVDVEVCLLPSHPVSGNSLRFIIELDGVKSMPIHYETKGRSEEWKQNVLRNQARKKITLPVSNSNRHKLSIKALDNGVILDQILIFKK